MSREEACSTLDGNAAAGLMREVFAFEATAARMTCAGCARPARWGSCAYAIEMGAIPCPHATRPSYGSPARRGGSGSICGARRRPVGDMRYPRKRRARRLLVALAVLRRAVAAGDRRFAKQSFEGSYLMMICCRWRANCAVRERYSYDSKESEYHECRIVHRRNPCCCLHRDRNACCCSRRRDDRRTSSRRYPIFQPSAQSIVVDYKSPPGEASPPHTHAIGFYLHADRVRRSNPR